MGQGSSKELVKAYEKAELEKGSRKPKESKWAKDAQEEKWDTGARKQCKKMPSEHTESLGEE